MTLAEHRGAIEADFQNFYGLDLTQVEEDEQMDACRLYRLVVHLPPDSALGREQDPQQGQPLPSGDPNQSDWIQTDDPKAIAVAFQRLVGG